MKKVLLLLLCVVLVFESGMICTENSTAEVSAAEKEPPIIFIPGVMGSNLYNSSKSFNLLTKVWTPDSLNLLTVGSYAKMSKTLYTRPHENQNAKGVTREYGALGVYKTMIDRLCKEFPNREVYFFSYDFRQDNTYTAGLLNNFIEGKGFDKVDIVCHSMGGLITSSYVSQFDNNRVNKKLNKVVTFGTPYEGLTRTFAGVMSKDVLANDKDSGLMNCLYGFGDLFLVVGGLDPAVKANMPALAQLAPTKSYVEGEGFFYRQTGTEKYGFLNLSSRPVYSEIDYKGYKDVSNIVFGSNYAKAETFHESILNNGMNVLAELDNSYFAVGVGQFTISSVKFNDGKTLKKLDIDEYLYEQQGDGAVPYMSASMMKKLESIKDSANRFKKFDADHNGVMGYDPLNKFSGDEKALNWMVDILKSGKSKIAGDTVSPSAYLVVKASAGSAIQVESNGEILSSVPEAFADSTSFGRLDFIGDEVIICIENTQDYDITILSDEDGADIQVSQYDEEGELVSSDKHKGLEEGTELSLDTKSEFEELVYVQMLD